MHPAYSVIVFTTASGLGYGLLFWLGLFGAFGLIEVERWSGLTLFALALGLITAGLLSSTAHLGRPERAWRAFSQWRSSWLSREGIAAVACYGPAGLFALNWIVGETVSGIWAAIGLAMAALAIITVYFTAMIYASLRTIRQWHQTLVPPVYVAWSLATGAVALNAVLHVFGTAPDWLGWLALLTLLITFTLKAIYWLAIDSDQPRYTVESATGLGQIGKVSTLEPAHTQANYIMREMGYRIARKHVHKLRNYVLIAGIYIPIVSILASVLTTPATAMIAAIVAAVSIAVGVVIERWLFFAEAEHVVTLYYGADAA